MQTQHTELDGLMARLADGDRSAFTGVFQRLWPPVLRLCTSVLRNEADAADAAQEAMHKILQRASDYDPARAALPWALTIAGWECKTLARKRSRRRETAEQAASDAVSEDAEVAALQRDLMEAALDALGQLSPIDRETLLATFWESVPSVSGATLRKRRERALDRLRSTFRRLYGLD